MSALSKAKIGGQIATIGVHVLWKPARKPIPETLPEIPESTAVITHEWLSAAPCSDLPRARVTGLRLGERTDGSTSQLVVFVDYNDEGRAARLPERMFCKSSLSFTSRFITGQSRALLSKADFYNALRPQIEIDCSKSYYATEGPLSGRSIFPMEDIAYTRGARFCTPTTMYINRQQPTAVVATVQRH